MERDAQGCRGSRGYRVFFDPTWVYGSAEMETVRKADRVSTRIGSRLPEVTVATCAPVSIDDLLRVHDDEYVEAFLTGSPTHLAASGLGEWSDEIVESVLGSTGGVIAAVHEAIDTGRSGALASGLHHARADSGHGFCTFNGLAIAAFIALERVASVGILDTDAHGGGGTFSIVGDHPSIRIGDVSTAHYDLWSSDAERHRTAFVSDPSIYLAEVAAMLDHIGEVDVLLYNAGMDPVTGVRAAGGTGFDGELMAERERLVADWCASTGTPVAFVLAGGYASGGLTVDDVADLHMHTVAAFAAA